MFYDVMLRVDFSLKFGCVDAVEHLSEYCYGTCYCDCSKSGLVSHEFFDPGVFYYSDQGYSEAAPYVGTVIVKPKVAEQFIELSQDGFSSGRVFINVLTFFLLNMIIGLNLKCNG